MLLGNLFEARVRTVKSDLFEIVDWDVSAQADGEDKLEDLTLLQELPKTFFDYFVVESRSK